MIRPGMRWMLFLCIYLFYYKIPYTYNVVEHI